MGLKLGNKTISTYSGSSGGGGGLMVGWRYVRKMWLGTRLIWDDSDCPEVDEMNSNGVLWAGTHSVDDDIALESSHGETNPWPVSGGTSDNICTSFIYSGYVKYDDGRIMRVYPTGKTGDKWATGKVVFNGTTQENINVTGKNAYATYTVPENSDPCGKRFEVYRETQKSGENRTTFYDYQTSDPHALFGLESDFDSSTNIDYGAWAKDSLTKSGDSYTVPASSDSSPKVMIFRPLEACQINFLYPKGYYCTVENVSLAAQLLNNVLNYTGTGLTTLPSSMSDLETSTYPSEMFQTLPKNLQIKPGQALLVGFFDGNKFDFSEKFELDTTSITLQGTANNGKSVNITTESTTSWTVSTTASWIKLSKTSGSGNGSVTITTTSANETGSVRTTSVTITTASGKEYYVYVRQEVYEAPALTFTNTPSPWTVTNSLSTNMWYVQDSGSMTNGTTVYIPFTVAKTGKVTLSYSGGISVSTCDPSSLGASISTSGSSFNYGDALSICSTADSKTYNVTTGTWYLQVKKNTLDNVMLNLQLAFSSN